MASAILRSDRFFWSARGGTSSGEPLVFVEWKKMEITILAPARGIVRRILVKPSRTVPAVDLVMATEEK